MYWGSRNVSSVCCTVGRVAPAHINHMREELSAAIERMIARRASGSKSHRRRRRVNLRLNGSLGVTQEERDARSRARLGRVARFDEKL